MAGGKQDMAGEIRRLDIPWEECGIEEKVERLRRELQAIRWALNEVRRRTRSFEEHEHNSKGEVVVPIRSKYSEGEASARDILA